MRIAYVGAGNMGARFINRLIDADYEVAVFDPRPEAVAAIAERGGVGASSAHEAAQGAEAVFASLPTPAVVEAVAFDLIPALPEGGAFVDMSTSPPDLARRIAAACEQRGTSALDAPVSNGGVFVTVGGPREVFERLRPAFEAMCERVLYVGEAGQGQVAKLARQYVSFTGLFTLLEGLLIAAKGGGDVRQVADFIAESVGARGPGRAMERLYAGDFGDPATSTAKLDIVAKDVALSVALAESVGAPCGTGAEASRILRAAQAEGWGDYECWIAARILEKHAGVELRLD